MGAPDYFEASVNEEHGEYVREMAERSGGLGHAAAVIAGAIDDLAATGVRQSGQFGAIVCGVASIREANQDILAASTETERVTDDTRTVVGSALDKAKVLAQAVERVEQGVTAVSRALASVSAAAEDIGTIAFQTRIVAFNASVEAGRAGEAGRGFAVVAEAVKDLAQRVHASSQLISKTVADLGVKIDALAGQANAAGEGDTGRVVEEAALRFVEGFGRVAGGVHEVRAAAEKNLAACGSLIASVETMTNDVTRSSEQLDAIKQPAGELLAMSEELIGLSAASGIETGDSSFILAVTEATARISRLFEQAVDSGEISLADLGDKDYRPIAGTDPQQYMTRFVAFTDRVLPAIQEPMLQLSDRVVFCAAVDRNGFLPTHNNKFSRPQGKDAVWNVANCRNRRIFNDRTGLAAGRNRKPFLLQTYRRDMGGGQFVIMKDLSAPITVYGRRWGGLRLAYRFG